MSVALYAFILLIFRAISVYLIVAVIRKQRVLRRRPISDVYAGKLREDMYLLAKVALAINIIPVIVDVLTIFSITVRPSVIHPVSALYMFSFSAGTLLLTLIIWRIYRNALR